MSIIAGNLNLPMLEVLHFEVFERATELRSMMFTPDLDLQGISPSCKVSVRPVMVRRGVRHPSCVVSGFHYELVASGTQQLLPVRVDAVCRKACQTCKQM